MGLVIDTNVLIEFERKKISLNFVFGEVQGECYFSVVTLSELLQGIERAHGATFRADRKRFIESVFSLFQLLPIDRKTAEIHAILWAELASRGAMIGIHDSWIAATALRYDHELLTLNTKEFERVAGLRIRNAL
jgi:tRNA(fMet)-specific endonuclease VapC